MFKDIWGDVVNAQMDDWVHVKDIPTFERFQEILTMFKTSAQEANVVYECGILDPARLWALKQPRHVGLEWTLGCITWTENIEPHQRRIIPQEV